MRIERKMWSGKCGWSLVVVRDAACSVIHAGKQANEPSGLKNDDELDAAAFKPSPDLHHFAEARVEPGAIRASVAVVGTM